MTLIMTLRQRIRAAAVCAVGGMIMMSSGIGAPAGHRTAPAAKEDLVWFLGDPEAQAVWAPFGTRFENAKPLEEWAMGSRSEAAHPNVPAFRNSLSLNCWEFVLYSALRNKVIDRPTAQAWYAARKRGEALSTVVANLVGIAPYAIDETQIRIQWPADLLPGDVVFMDQTSHVVQLTGTLDAEQRRQVVSFSPRPIWGDGSSEVPLRGIRPEVTTVESLIEEMRDLYPDVPSDWNNIELRIVRIGDPARLGSGE